MSTFKVTKENITVIPHPNADRLELAVVGLFHAVVMKGQFQTGDEALYIPEQAILPAQLIETLGLTGKLAGPEKNRVQPVRLRGEVSQGVVTSVGILPEGTPGDLDDYAEVLGITKFEPVVPEHFKGTVIAAADLTPWFDIENVKRYPDVFQPGEIVHVTEKVHGINVGYTFLNPGSEDEKVFATSKGLGAQRLALAEDEENIYWRAYHQNDVKGFAHSTAAKFAELNGGAGQDGEFTPAVITKVAVFGEVFGAGVQDLHYGRTSLTPGFVVFDVHITYVGADGFTREHWVDPQVVAMDAVKAGLDTVPVIFEGEYDLQKVTELATGKEQVSGKELHLREGVIVRSLNRGDYWTGSQKIVKFISDAYLLRGGNATEYN